MAENFGEKVNLIKSQKIINDNYSSRLTETISDLYHTVKLSSSRDYFEPKQLEENSKEELEEHKNDLIYDAFVLKEDPNGQFKPLDLIINIENDINSEFIKQWKDTELDHLKCKFLIVIAMYDEKAEELDKTLQGVLGDILLFNEGNVSPDQIGCIIIVDGIEPFYKTYRSNSNRNDPGNSDSRCSCCGFCRKKDRHMREVDSRYFSKFFDEWKIVERFTYQIVFNDHLKHLDDLKFFYDTFHGSKQLTRRIIRMEHDLKEVLIKLFEHKEHHSDFIKIFEENKNDEERIDDEDYEQAKKEVFMGIFSADETDLIDEYLYTHLFLPAYKNGPDYIELVIKVAKLPNIIQNCILESLKRSDNFIRDKENLEINIRNLKEMLQIILKTDIHTLENSYFGSYEAFHSLDDNWKNILFSIVEILKQAINDFEYLKEICRRENVRNALEKTLKLSLNKERAIRFLERSNLTQSVIEEKSEAQNIFNELLRQNENPNILIDYLKFTNKYPHFREPLLTNDDKEKEKYQFKLIKYLSDNKFLEEKDEIAHCFSTKIEVKNTDLFLNTMLCVKQINKRKLNTHRWFLEGFCKIIKPKYVMMLDVGTKPEINGLYSLFDCMEDQPNVAGCCGEIIPEQKPGFFDLVVGSQTVEYKFSHILDKALESATGYVSVLPGAFSAYRMECINSDVLEKYFYSQRNTMISLFHANMYLAEDRILCLELVCQKGKANILKYVHESIATTDVPETLDKLIAQRRRWINGSWFSMIYTIRNWTKICRSNHSWCFKSGFFLLTLYYSIIALFNWVLVGAFYLAFALSLKRNLGETSNNMDRLTKFSTAPIIIYFSTLLTITIMSLSVKPRKVMTQFNIISIIFGFYTIATIVLTLFFVLKNTEIFNDYLWMKSLAFIFIGTGALMFGIIVLLYITDKRIWHMIKSVPSFIFMTGTFVNVFMVYSVCNLHDCSWGNRPDKMTLEEKNMADDYKSERTRWLIVWCLCNGCFVYSLNYLNGMDGTYSHVYINILAFVAFGIVAVKFIGGICYFIGEISRRCRRWIKRRKNIRLNNRS